MNFTILRFDSIGSTNTEALNEARLGAPEGLTIVARGQTAGRGRHGRVWLSGPDAGLYFSIVLRPSVTPQLTPLLTLMTAVAVADLLRDRFHLAPDIKWVNDVLIGERKICGILAELTESATGRAVVVGIGINLRASAVAPELAETATSVETETGVRIAADDALDAFLGYFGYLYDRFGDDPSFVIDEWASRSTYFRGKRVRAAIGTNDIVGVTDGLEANGALRIRDDSGAVHVVTAGEITRLRTVEEKA